MKRVSGLIVFGALGFLSQTAAYSQAPPAPTLSSPSNGAILTTTSVEFDWNSVSGADDYHIQVATDENFSNIVDEDHPTGTSITYDNLNDENTYYWHLASDSYFNGEGDFSSPAWSFSISFPQIISISPNNGNYSTFNASNLASGIYFARLAVQPQKGEQYQKTMKMVLLK